MKNKISTHWTILLIVITFVLFTSCGKESDNEIDIKPNMIQEHPVETVKTTTEDNTTIQEKIDQSIKQAENTYKKFGKFRDEVFQHALEQARSILCSVYRIKKLDSTEFSGSSVSEILKRQNFVSISYIDTSKYLSKNNEGLKASYHYKVEIPMAKNYDKDYYIFFVDHYYKGYSDGENRYNYLIIEGNLEGYNRDYNKPIPNDQIARDIEKKVHAEEIIRALQRLNMCYKKLPIIEREAAKALSFSIVLKKLKDDLTFDMLDPTLAEGKVKEYREFLNQAVSVLNDSRQALSSAIAVNDEERNEIISILEKY